MAVKIKIGRQTVGQFGTNIAARMRTAVQLASDEVANTIKSEGDANIKGAGQFGHRWTDAFHVSVNRPSPNSINANIDVYFDLDAIPYAYIHEYGGTIHGNPLLWIPLSFAPEAKGIYARDYPEPLFRVDRTRVSGGGFTGHKRTAQGHFTGGFKAPLLFSKVDRKPKYFGIPSVTIRPKFGIRALCATVAARFSSLYGRLMREQ